jgi:hypothetical protein
MSEIKGSCCCGKVSYTLAGEVKSIVNCHCNLCRKMNGAAFSTYVVVLASEMKLAGGDVKTFGISSESTRTTCENCSTPLYNENPKYAGLRMLYFGSLDQQAALTPAINIYCESEVDWLGELPTMKRLDQGVR